MGRPEKINKKAFESGGAAFLTDIVVILEHSMSVMHLDSIPRSIRIE